MATQWMLLLLFGSVFATPFRKLSRDEGIHQKREEEKGPYPSEDLNTFDRIDAVNIEADVEGELYQGDIRKDSSLKEALNEKRGSTHRNFKYLWLPSIIPYIINASITSDVKANIDIAIANFHQHTCIKWVERTTESYYVVFEKLKGCWSSIGNPHYDEGYQVISIGKGCDQVGTIMHEMMHCVGMWHEQSRPDSVNVVEIMWEHVKEGTEENFEPRKDLEVTYQGTNYDYKSLMQYGNYAFSKDGKMTIRLLSSPATIFGQNNGFSSDDIIALNNLYSCSVTNGGWGLWGAFSPCSSSCKKTRSRFCRNENLSACNAGLPEGIETEEVVCPDSECYAPVNGVWSRWTAWGSCSKTCDDGTKTRTRKCKSPAPKFGGLNCVGSNVDTSSCILKSCSAGPGDCGFDDINSKFCDWHNDASSTNTKFPDWRWGSSTPSSKTGPVGDHTTGTERHFQKEATTDTEDTFDEGHPPGSFAYAEASGCLDNRGTLIRMKSVQFPASSSAGRCMTFYYYAKGVQVGGLSVYVRDTSANTMSKCFHFTGEQGAEWKKVDVPISHASGSYEIVLEMVCGGDYRGDIAVDDISFKDGAC